MKICPECIKLYSNRHEDCSRCGAPLMDYDEWDYQQHHKNEYATAKLQQQYQPHCPICGSPNVEKISVANKVGKGLLFGIFSIGTISKTYHCKNCGSKF